MKTLEFKNNDTMPALGLGTWKSEPGEVYQAIIDAVKIGYRHIDCAPIYANEAEIGLALKHLFSNNIVKREEMWITSKLWCNAHATEEVVPALKKTLKDLRLRYLDLFLVHWPIALKPNVMFAQKAEDMISLNTIPTIATWKGMEQCVEKGLARHIGVSNFSIPKLKGLISLASIKPEMNQIELHPLLQQQSMLDFCRMENIFLTAYSPLGSQDRMPSFKAKNEPSLLENPVIVKIAKKHKVTTAQVLINWAITRGTSVIPKSVNPGRLKQNFEAENFQLSEEDMNMIRGLDRHFRFITGGFWAIEGSSYTVQNLWDE
jgi:alcohol dehydrogenase (NADP+)